MSIRRREQKYENKPLVEINVTPLVDVMLVLLIIFMVTAPMLQMGIDVNLPKAKAKVVDLNEEIIVLTVKSGNEIFINKLKIAMNEIKSKLEAIYANRVDKEIFLQADQNVPYGTVVQVMGEVRKAGIEKMGMVTDTPEDSR